MEDKLISCRNCKFFLQEQNSKDCIHYSCLKNGKTKFPKQLGLLDNCALSLRDCYQEKNGEKENYGKNINTRNHRRSSKHKVSNN